ncbi:MAG: DNA polymerase III subunit delta [Patescibacteria group bacterium]
MIYFIYGEDSYRSKKKLEEIILGYKKVHKSGLNLVYVDAGKTDFNDFYSNFKITSMFAEKKLIVLKNVFSRPERAEGPSQKFQEEFLENFKNLEKIEDIIIVFEYDAVDERKKLFKILKKETKCQELSFLFGLSLKKWAKEEFEKNKTKINPDAEDLLLAFTGNDLWQLANEINKLSNYKREGYSLPGLIKKEDVELLVRPKLENDIFKTIEAMAQKNKKEAFSLLHKHIENGDNALYLLSMIAYQFKNLLIIKELIEKRLPYAVVSKNSGLHPFVVKKTYYLCGQFSFNELKKIYQKIFQADLDIKTGKIDPELTLDLLVSEV